MSRQLSRADGDPLVDRAEAHRRLGAHDPERIEGRLEQERNPLTRGLRGSLPARWLLRRTSLPGHDLHGTHVAPTTRRLSLRSASTCPRAARWDSRSQYHDRLPTCLAYAPSPRFLDLAVSGATALTRRSCCCLNSCHGVVIPPLEYMVILGPEYLLGFLLAFGRQMAGLGPSTPDTPARPQEIEEDHHAHEFHKMDKVPPFD